jgi:hypothetical protein
METRQPSCHSTTAVLDIPDERLPVPQHITAELFDGETSPLWETLLADATQFPTTTVCVVCGGERVEYAEFSDHDPGTGERYTQSGIHCRQCGALEEESDERNDLAEALRIAGSHPVHAYRGVPQLERRHLLAVVSHCLYLMEAAHGSN